VQNCAVNRSPCIYPLPQPHLDPSLAAEALGYFERALALEESWTLKWLVHFTETAMGETEELAAFARPTQPVEPMPRLVERAFESGAEAVNLGKGSLVGDLDGDGRLDIVAGEQFGPLMSFRNDGDRRFTETSASSGIGAVSAGFMPGIGDVDNDGDLDLYIGRDAFFGTMENVLLRNDGSGVFSDATAESGLGDPGATFVTPFADYDLDGDLDVFVANLANPNRIGLAFETLFGKHASTLYRNNGDGTFTDVGEEAGVSCVDSHLGASWGDFDGDGDPDLLNTTYFGLNHLYENLGDGTFRDVAEEKGLREPWSSFSGWFFDYDGDLDLDIFVPSHAPTEAVAKYNVTGVPPLVQFTMRLYRNEGDGSFTDVTTEAGLQVAASAMGANWGDINGDGWPDFYIATGGPLLNRIEPNMLFVNRGDGSFWNATFETGTGSLQKGHGVSFTDLDGDGRQELHVSMGGAWPVDTWANLLFWNETEYADGERPHFVKVVLRGVKSNSHGVGAKVIVRTGDRAILREVGAGGGFGVNPFIAEFGLGRARSIDSIEVLWPGQTSGTVYENLPADVTVLIEEGADSPLLLEPWVSSPMHGVAEADLPLWTPPAVAGQ